MKRTILHSDMNSFYASVEMMLNPDLRGKAVAVCGSTENRHGIVLAKSELAKRAGVKTGMVNWQAKQVCPNLIMVPPNYNEYLKISKLAHKIYERYTDLIEPFGMDECWLDVTGSSMVFGDGVTIANEIKSAIKRELGVNVSIGVSFNKIFAKLGSDMKKPDAVTEIRRDNFREKIWNLPAYELLYVGRATSAKLESCGINTIGQIAQTEPEILEGIFGVHGGKMWTYANGLDESRVMHMNYKVPIKSVGHGTTCVTDLVNNDEVDSVFLELSVDVGHRLRINNLLATGVQIMVRTEDLSFRQYQTKLSYPTRNPLELTYAARKLFREKYYWSMNVRSLTIRAIDLVPDNTPVQTTFDCDAGIQVKMEKIFNTVDDLNIRYGKKTVMPAALLQNIPIAADRCDEIKIAGRMFA